MVIKEDGTKWACQSCLKGHRVSACNHVDRPLQFVKKKGRPVTQCQHCRSERRKRSQHVKCGCGDKDKHNRKCVHLEEKGEHHSEGEGHDLGAVPEGDESDDHTCCCHHGEKCTCSTVVKKGHSRSGSDNISASARLGKSKPRLTTTVSEGHLSVFPSAQKPTRPNTVADTNSPYRVHKPHPAHGLHAAGHRSVDSLALMEKSNKSAKVQPPQPTSAPQRPVSQGNTQIRPLSTGPDMFQAFSVPVNSGSASGHDEFYNRPSFSGMTISSPTIGEVPYQYTQYRQPSTQENTALPVFDWSSIGQMQNAQPALTYASSTTNTYSEIGEHTPPDEVSSAFGFQSNLPSRPMPIGGRSRQPNAMPTYEDVAVAPENQQRWSLPPGFFGDSNMNTSFDFTQPSNQARAGSYATSYNPQSAFAGFDDNSLGLPAAAPSQTGTQDDPFMSFQTMTNEPFASQDGGTSRPPQRYSYSANDVNQPFDFDPTVFSQQTSGTFDFGGFSSGGKGPETAATQYAPSQTDPFFGSDVADPFDFGDDFPIDQPRHTWHS